MSFDTKTTIKACLKDDRSAQEKLYREYAPKMYAVCKSYADSRDEAMDMLQEGFIAVFNSLKNYRFDGALEGWIRKIIVYKCIDLLRSKKRYNEKLEVFASDYKSLNEGNDIEYPQDGEMIKSFINNLPGKAGLILKLFILEGYSHKEISDLLEISIGTSKSQLNRAKQLLKNQMQKINHV